MKTILAMLLVLCSTSVFAYEDVLICYNPVHVTEDKYKEHEIDRVIINHNYTKVLLKDGSQRVYSPSIQCYYEVNSKRSKA